jgi:UDP:flavonoid glycosyltransferase YjiC (YdhE family)
MMGFPEIPLPGWNKTSYQLAEIAAWRLFSKSINRWREEVLGLPGISRKNYFQSNTISDNLILKGFSRRVVVRPRDWGEHVHITGYWFPEDREWKPPVSLLEFLESGPPPVFIGFGSMPIKDPGKTTELILKALKLTGQRGVLGAGWGGIGNSRLPAYLYKTDYAPYEWLFPQMGMVIHHGGSGTTGFALKAGVPSCAVGLGFDQIFWGKRVAALGAGPDPHRLRGLTAERLAAVIEKGIHNDFIQQRAREIGAIIQEENGIQEAVRLIEYKYGNGPKRTGKS